jgi:hypothetical protein
MNRTRFAFATLTAAALLGAALPVAAQEEQAPPSGKIEEGVFVPTGSTLAEVLEQQKANKEMADFAKTQVADNNARLAAYEQARAAYEAELARVAAETKAREAEVARLTAAHEAAVAKWRADVDACAKGEEDHCAPKAEDS